MSKKMNRSRVFVLIGLFALASAGGAEQIQNKAEVLSMRNENRLNNGSFDVSDVGWWWSLPDMDSHVNVGMESNNCFLAVFSAMKRGRSVDVFSSWFTADKSEQMVTVSFNARGRGEGCLSLGFVSPDSSVHTCSGTQTFKLLPHWQRFEFSLPLTAAQMRSFQVVFSTFLQMDLDEVEVGSAAKVDGFQAFAPLEAGLSCTESTRIFYNTETPRFVVHVSCPHPDQSLAPLLFEYQLTDYNDQSAGQGSFAVHEGASERQEFEIPVAKPGFYRIHWSVGGGLVKGQDAFVVTTLPPPLPDPRFSITMGDSNYRQSAQQIKRMGAGGIRLHGFFQNLGSNDIFRMDSSLLDYLVKETGAGLLAMLTGAPGWMLDDQGRLDVPTALKALDAVVSQTAPYVEAYEIFNEPNCGFPGSAEDYARYLAAAYDRLKSTHPGKMVVGICPSNILLTYIEQVLNAGGAGKMDVLSFHPYGLTSPDVRGIDQELRRLKQLASDKNSGNPPALWTTEIGYQGSDRPMNKPQRFPGIKMYNEAEVARFMVKMNLMLLDGGVDRMYWFHLPGVGGLPNPFYYGFTYENPEHAIPKKQVAAFCQMTRALAGITMKGRVKGGDDELYLYRFAKTPEDGSSGRWAVFKDERADDRHVFFVRSAQPVRYENIVGTENLMLQRAGDIRIIEAKVDPAYVFDAAGEAGEVVVPVTVDQVPDLVMDDSQIRADIKLDNVFDRPVTVHVQPRLPQGWQSEPSQLMVTLAAGERRTVPLTVVIPPNEKGMGLASPAMHFEVQLKGIMDEPYVLTRKISLKLRKYLDLKPRTIDISASKWTDSSPGRNWTVKTTGGNVVQVNYVFNGSRKQGWGVVKMPFDRPQDLGGFRQVTLEMKFSNPSGFTLSMMLVDPSGALYRAVADVDVAVRDRWQTVKVNLSEFTSIGSSGTVDDNGKLDLDQILEIGLLGNSHGDSTGVFQIRSITFEP